MVPACAGIMDSSNINAFLAKLMTHILWSKFHIHTIAKTARGKGFGRSEFTLNASPVAGQPRFGIKIKERSNKSNCRPGWVMSRLWPGTDH